MGGGKKKQKERNTFQLPQLIETMVVCFLFVFFLALVNRFFNSSAGGRKCLQILIVSPLRNPSTSKTTAAPPSYSDDISFFFYPCRGEKSPVPLEIANIHFGMTFSLAILAVSSKCFLSFTTLLLLIFLLGLVWDVEADENEKFSPRTGQKVNSGLLPKGSCSSALPTPPPPPSMELVLIGMCGEHLERMIRDSQTPGDNARFCPGDQSRSLLLLRGKRLLRLRLRTSWVYRVLWNLQWKDRIMNV